MQLELGKIYDGKVTSIKEYGAFVEILEENVTGMVHISQISNEFVSNAKDYLTEGQTVKVKFIGTNEDGKIKLSIKEALAPSPKKNTQQHRNYGNGNGNGNYSKRNNYSNNRNRSNNHGNSNHGDGGNYYASNGDERYTKKSSGENFEDMLNKFKQRSDENLNDLKKITDRRNRSKRK
jgi:S1 RNA binding domain protein